MLQEVRVLRALQAEMVVTLGVGTVLEMDVSRMGNTEEVCPYPSLEARENWDGFLKRGCPS